MTEAEVQTARPTHSPLSPPPSDAPLHQLKHAGVNGSAPSTPPENVQRIIEYIWNVLQSHDTIPSTIDRISKALPLNRSSEKSSSKKQKLSHATSARTIAEKVEQSAYTSLDELASDLQTATAQLLASVALPSPALNGKPAWSYATDADDQAQRRLAAQAKSFRQIATNLIAVEAGARVKQEQSQHHDVKAEVRESSGLDEALPAADPGRAVLTLFGNAQGHKQLFSSFQRPLSKLKRPAATTSAVLSSEQAVMPLRETGLPNNMFSTRILPVAAEDVAAGRKGQTFADIFAPPPSIPQLQPPKSRNGQARGDTVSWAKDRPVQETRRMGYTHEKLPTGQWLGYGGVVQTQEPTSPEAKRKRRDRALSTGEAVLAPSEGAKAAQLQAKEEALFRCAYSSFAPSRDNSGALISEEDKSQIWWERFGHDYFEQISAYPLEGIDGHGSSHGRVDEDAEFAAAVDEFDPVNYEAPVVRSAEERETAELLEDISEMLETLHSHQRIRNSSLTGNPKSSISPSSSLNDLTGTPSTPSSAEIILHDTLKQQLALMVSMLPPYAVAKLNGEQLEELNISRHVPFEDSNYRGVMDEDQASRLARQAALQAAVGAAAVPARPIATPGSYGARPPAIAQPTRPAGTGYGGYQPSTMPRGSSFARQPLSSWQSPAQQAYQRHGYAQVSNNVQTPSGTPGLAPNRARPAVGLYAGGRPLVNGYGSQFQQRQGSQSTSGFGAGSPVPRNGSPQGYQAPTPQMTRPGSSSHSQYTGNQSPPQPRPGSAYASHPSPSKSGPAGYLTPTASSVNSNWQNAAATAAVESRPQTPSSVADALGKGEQQASMSVTPTSDA